jgi:NH3-dependent NAD+ synthetase
MRSSPHTKQGLGGGRGVDAGGCDSKCSVHQCASIGPLVRCGAHGTSFECCATLELKAERARVSGRPPRCSSKQTQARAEALAKELGASHLTLRIDAVTSALVTVFSAALGRTPRFAAMGGSRAENLALQNIQARVRMVTAFFLAQVSWASTYAFFLLLHTGPVGGLYHYSHTHYARPPTREWWNWL